MNLRKTRLLLFILLTALSGLQAQKTAVFNGKTYFVYPQVLSEKHYYPVISIESYSFKLSNVYFPPILENLPDGEYLLYYEPSYHQHALSFRKWHNRKMIKDSVHVYGTFTLRNGKKEGKAIVYDYKSKNTIKAILEYSSDILNGRVQLFGGEGKLGILMQANSTDGIINGKVRKLVLNHSDSIPVLEAEVVNGITHGKYMHVEYYVRKQQFHEIYYEEGEYRNGKVDSVWNRKDMDGNLYQKSIYDNGHLVKRVFYSNNMQVSAVIFFGKDTVLKLAGPFSTDTLMPYTERDLTKEYYYYSADWGRDKYKVDLSYMALFKRSHPGDSLKLCFLVSEGYANKSHFNNLRHYYRDDKREASDTFINWQRFRIYRTYAHHRLSTEEMVYLEKTKEWNSSRFESILLQTRFFNKKGQEIYVKQEKEYVHYITHDTMQPFLISGRGWRGYHEKEYYQEALDLKFANSVFKSHGTRYSTSYSVWGDHATGTIIKYTEFVKRRDTFLFVDTLMLKGKYLESSDSFLNQSLNYMLKNYVGRLMPLNKAYHTVVKLNGKLYSGKILVRTIYGSAKDMIGFSCGREGVIFLIHRPLSLLRGRYDERIIGPLRDRRFHCRNGALDGTVTYIGIFGDTIFTSALSKNKLDSSIIYTTYKLFGLPSRRKNRYSSNRMYYKYCKRNLRAGPVARMQFLSGQKQGMWYLPLFYSAYTLNFQDDKLNGLQVEEYSTYRNIFNMKNNTLEGSVLTLLNSGMVYQKGSFKKGIPDGKFIEYGKQDTLRPKMSMDFDNGLLKGDLLVYFDSGNLKTRIHFMSTDSNKFSYVFYPHGSRLKEVGIDYNSRGRNLLLEYEYSSNTLVDSWLETIFQENTYLEGTYTFFYKEGGIFLQGTISAGFPYGDWKFYRQGQRLYKTVRFMDSVVSVDDLDSIKIFGKVNAYYDNGKLMFTGYATDDRLQYSCESDADMPIEENIYLEFYDTLGKSLLVNGSGFITEYQASGHKLREGHLDSFRKQGVWILYSKFGLPEEMGAYKQGKKDGRWLIGDLGGLNLDEKLCYMSDDEFREWVSRFGGNLSLTEVYYVDGREVSRNTVDVIRN